MAILRLLWGDWLKHSMVIIDFVGIAFNPTYPLGYGSWAAIAVIPRGQFLTLWSEHIVIICRVIVVFVLVRSRLVVKGHFCH